MQNASRDPTIHAFPLKFGRNRVEWNEKFRKKRWKLKWVRERKGKASGYKREDEDMGLGKQEQKGTLKYI